MKISLPFYSIFLCLLLLLSNCKNDVELNAPYKEIPSIYALLNPNEKTHTIRVNKVFLGEGDANKMAKVADSVNYGAGELSVSIYGVNKNGISHTRVFNEELIQTEAGAFSTTQRVYVCKDGPTDSIFMTGSYTLTVKNLKTGNSFTAKTKALSQIRIPGFTPLCAPAYPVPATNINKDNPDVFVSFYSLTSPKSAYSIRFYPNEAIIYQPILRFHFYDSLPGSATYRYVDYAFGNMDLASKITAGPIGFRGTLSLDFFANDVFYAVGYGIKKMGLDNQVLGRRMYKLQVLVHSSTQDYKDYLEFAKPSLNIAQNKPLYSNFDNRAALGIFTFRTTFSIEKELASFYINALAENENICAYKFYKYGTTTVANCQ